MGASKTLERRNISLIHLTFDFTLSFGWRIWTIVCPRVERLSFHAFIHRHLNCTSLQRLLLENAFCQRRRRNQTWSGSRTRPTTKITALNVSWYSLPWSSARSGLVRFELHNDAQLLQRQSAAHREHVSSSSSSDGLTCPPLVSLSAFGAFGTAWENVSTQRCFTAGPFRWFLVFYLGNHLLLFPKPKASSRLGNLLTASS